MTSTDMPRGMIPKPVPRSLLAIGFKFSAHSRQEDCAGLTLDFGLGAANPNHSHAEEKECCSHGGVERTKSPHGFTDACGKETSQSSNSDER